LDHFAWLVVNELIDYVENSNHDLDTHFYLVYRIDDRSRGPNAPSSDRSDDRKVLAQPYLLPPTLIDAALIIAAPASVLSARLRGQLTERSIRLNGKTPEHRPDGKPLRDQPLAGPVPKSLLCSLYEL
jgi:hypothetical protein